MVLVIVQIQSYAAGILDNSPVIQGVYITLMCFVLLGRAGFYELQCICGGCCVSSRMSLLLLRQQLKLAPSDRRWIDAATLHFKCKLLKRGLLCPRNC